MPNTTAADHGIPRTNTLDAQLDRYAARLAELRDEARDKFDAFAPGDLNRECYRERAASYTMALHDLACYTGDRFGERYDAKAQVAA